MCLKKQRMQLTSLDQQVQIITIERIKLQLTTLKVFWSSSSDSSEIGTVSPPAVIWMGVSAFLLFSRTSAFISEVFNKKRKEKKKKLTKAVINTVQGKILV